MKLTTAASARAFHTLHQAGLLLLPNAWDAGSARLIESVGAKAIATTSAAVAWSHGYEDGNFLPGPMLVATVSEIIRVIHVPLSVDLEGGFSDDPVAVGATVAAIIGEGAVGINIEDGSDSPELLCRKIEQAKRAGTRAGVDLFVNARTDSYLRNTVAPERRLEVTLVRAELYRAAGADGIFVPGLVDAAAIRTVAATIKLPLNVMARGGLPAAAELVNLGVRRLSAGSSIPEVMYGRIAAMAASFLRTGESAPLVHEAMPYREINALMKERA
jgi:2-methylisocitrate lyase-like PEP mutase family enzyme